ncbi:hypothetical protein CNBA2520 [Cryptococcus deneoformans B-3501A]|uniref:Expressed protein n=1 Tax=Cryptococcus deneoformans (strain JEC21 / ATCC MYA-565) TaxID=214684 RepID=Q5KPI7_CRYD1|nr:expressed protein [Cryptococcus neoformans var. neoformans JEC21]XP_778252.1 hypothetical protein CNBA2520 [Cryptococcus neoformans var. neoformans B-3501A]AAW40840.1 expressed protein [Cryptococcus neoformans var. neoformans JEC21]EAL23605.1 hypothetical protein CNBA2520 [Cryptococcus neoformans var. neoformans B-3501A]
MGIFTHSAEDDVLVSASFPETNAFGNVVNGEDNNILIHLINSGSKNYTLVSASASYHDPANHWALVKNATTLKYGVPLVSGANFSAPYHVYSEFRPQELGLTVTVNLAETGTKDLHYITAMNRTVSIVEAPGSWLDFQLIFLYLILGTALTLGGWWAYDSYFAPKSKVKGKKKSGPGPKKVQAVVPGKESVYPEVKPYEEEWIPEQLLKSKQNKLKKRNVDGASSAGEITSGGETSGAEGKGKKRKGKKA